MYAFSESVPLRQTWSWRQWFKFLLLMGIGYGLLWHLYAITCTLSYTLHNPFSTSFMDTQMAELQRQDLGIKKQQIWVPYEQISLNLKRAVLAAEDAKFVNHHGFDWVGMRQAWTKNIRKGHIVAGGSTVSQQLAKNLFLSPQRTIWRKLDEAALTVALETVLSKERMFEIYLNVIEWGEGIYGIEAAAHYYFGISANRLSASQAAYLASLIPNPRYFQKHRHSVHLNRKMGIVMARMRQTTVP
jgi:monofunctional biosynthetic peptidoglycan transglycosylase